MSSSKPQIAYSEANIKDLFTRYYRDPAGFMEDILGMDLDEWQREVCADIHNYDRFAISSGHSSGKRALTAGIIIWFITMHPNPQIIVTANTEKQLTQKTWRELAKWHKNSLIVDWFKWSATTFSMVEHSETWFAAAVPQTEHNSEAFAGAHEKFILQIFDEASSIPQIIHEVAEGATATEGGYRKWFLFGNPTLNAGPFYDACFGSRSHRWKRIVIDTRTCKYADQEQIKAWEEDYGEDSDFFRVRVKGLPPEQSITTLIGAKAVRQAVQRTHQEQAYRFAPKILGIDVARFGDDETVICFRQGVKLHWIKAFRGLNEMQVAEKVANEIIDLSPSAVFMDNTGGYGAGAYDRLRQLKYSVIPVNFSSRDGVNEQYQNMRISMWDQMREWIDTADIPQDQMLERDLTTPEYMYNRSTGKKQLESKEDIKKRLGRSPDRADGVAVTFSYPVQPDEPERFLSEAEKDWRRITGQSENNSTWTYTD